MAEEISTTNDAISKESDRKTPYQNMGTIPTAPSKKEIINDIVDIKEKDMIRVHWEDNSTCDFPYIFLRDSCQCSACLHPISKQRILDTVEAVDIDIQVVEAHHITESNTLVLTWPDKHQSTFNGKSLKDMQLPVTTEKKTTKALCGIQVEHWFSAKMKQQLPLTNFDALMASDDILLTYFENLFKHGLAIITGAPTRKGIFHELSRRISYSYLKQTVFGDTFTVRSKPSPSDIAYTPGHLALHVDQPSYSYQPEVQFLHCIEQSAGEDAGISSIFLCPVDTFVSVSVRYEEHSRAPMGWHDKNA